MLKKIIAISFLMLMIVALISVMPTANIQAQDTEPTPIPVLPEATEDDSAAPVAPGIEPPVITDPGDDNAPLPEATEAVDEAPADT
ncbi:MAG: hypothetical protein ACFE0Q_18990, partial [Anaerolineae bacterium]